MPHRESSTVVFTGEIWGQAWGFMLREDMKVIKGEAVHIWGLLGNLVSMVNHCCAVHDRGILKKVRRIQEETDAPS